MYSCIMLPSKYVQGRAVLPLIGEFLVPLGKRALLLRGKTTASIVDTAITAGLQEQGIELAKVDFGGECSEDEIARVAEIARAEAADIIIGAGGGKVIDVVKSVGYPADLAVVMVPTIAATDAPTSSVVVLYTAAGVFAGVRFYRKNPDLVLVDLEIIARAPVRYLVAGMGDALSTWFEADTARRAHRPNTSGGLATQAALKWARLCYETLLADGLAARRAVEKGVVTPAVERIVEANILLSGIGAESGGLAAAHSVHNGLTVLPETAHYYHGEKVAFGTLTQLVLEGRRTDEMREVAEFCLSVGLPLTLGELGVTNLSPENLMPAAELACAPGEIIHNEPFPVTPQMVYEAMLAADALGKEWSVQRKG